MSEGKILTAQHDGLYLIKLTGDVRVTLCKTIDAFYDTMLGDDRFTGVAVDLSEAEGIDSTTLGLLAKLAIKAKARLQYKVTVYSPNPSITRLLSSMGFQNIFHITETVPVDEVGLGELPVLQVSEEGARDRVIEAHRILMGMNEKNRAEFQPLVTALEHI